MQAGTSNILSSDQNNFWGGETRRSWFRLLVELARHESSRGKIVIIGIGHPLRGDDYVGSLVAKDLSKKPGNNNKFTIIDAEDSPESIIGSLQDQKPGLVVIIDALDARSHPGTITMVDLDKTTYPIFSTHNIPMRVLLDAFPETHRSILLGVQPASTEIGEPLSKQVSKARTLLVQRLTAMMESFGGH